MSLSQAFAGIGWFAAQRLNRLLVLIALLHLLTGCAISTPYREGAAGPAWPAAEVMVVVTEAVLSPDPTAREGFWTGVKMVEADLPRQPGLVGYSLRRQVFGNRVWTMTAWASEADMRRFVTSPAHREAMKLGSPALAEFRSKRLPRPASAWPLSWEAALQVLNAKPDAF